MLNLTYCQGHEITGREELVRLDQLYWTARLPNKDKDFRYTFKDVGDFDGKIERAPRGFTAAYLDGKPAAIAKVMRINTRGLKEEIPETSDKLTDTGTWSTYDPKGDTTVLTTFSVDINLRRYPINGERLTDVVFRQISSFYDYTEFKISYTPLTGWGSHLHCRHGAKPVVLLRNARPFAERPNRHVLGFLIDVNDVEHVVIWGYKWPKHDQQLLGQLSEMFQLDCFSRQ